MPSSSALALDDLGVVSGDTFELPGYNDGPSGGGVWPGSSGSGGDVGAMPLPGGVPDTGGSPHGGPGGGGGGGGGGAGSGEGPKVDALRAPYLGPRDRLNEPAQNPFNISNSDCSSSTQGVQSIGQVQPMRLVEDEIALTLPMAERVLTSRANIRELRTLEADVAIAFRRAWDRRHGDARAWDHYAASLDLLQHALDLRNAAYRVWVSAWFLQGRISPSWCKPRGTVGPAESIPPRTETFWQIRRRLIVDADDGRFGFIAAREREREWIPAHPDWAPEWVSDRLGDLQMRYGAIEAIFFDASESYARQCGRGLFELSKVFWLEIQRSQAMSKGGCR